MAPRLCRDGCAARTCGCGRSPTCAVANGTGWSTSSASSARGTGHFHSLGMVLSGTRMTLLRMDHDGQDHNYAPGKDPMELAVKAASARMG